MNGAELLAEVRLRLRDQAAPLLWSDAEIYAYLNEAQRQFCMHTHSLLDFDCYTIQTAAGVNRYELDDEVLSVLLAKISTETVPLKSYANPTAVTFNSTQSKPTCYGSMGGKPTYLSLIPTPDDTYTIQLGVATLPSELLTAGSEPQIALQYHRSLSVGAIVECLSHADTDGFDPDLLAIYEERWAITLRDAKRDVYLRTHGANSMVKFPNWAGGS